MIVFLYMDRRGLVQSLWKSFHLLAVECIWYSKMLHSHLIQAWLDENEVWSSLHVCTCMNSLACLMSSAS